MWPNPHETPNLVAFIEGIRNEKLLFCAMRVINFKKIADVSFLTQGFFYQNEDVVLKN